MSEYKSISTDYVTRDKHPDTLSNNITNSRSISNNTTPIDQDLYFLKNPSKEEIYKIIRNNNYKKNYSLRTSIESYLGNIFYNYFCYFIKKKLSNLPNVDDYKNLFLKELYNISFWDIKKKDREFHKFTNWLEKYKNISKHFISKILFIYLTLELVLLVSDRIFIDQILRKESENSDYIIKYLKLVGVDLYDYNLEFIFYKITKRLSRFLYENIDKIIHKNINYENRNVEILENIFIHKQDIIKLSVLTISSGIPIKQILELNIKLQEFQNIFNEETRSLIEYKRKLQIQHKNNVSKVLSYINSDNTNTDSVSNIYSNSCKTNTESITSNSTKESSNYLKKYFSKNYSQSFNLQEIENIKLPEEYHIKKLDDQSEEIKYINLPIKKK